jgi:hypothetical protein
MHYWRIQVHGDPGPAEKLTRWGENLGKTCSVEKCKSPAELKGWCRFHYDRVRFTGETGQADRLRKRPSDEVKAYTLSERHRYFKYGLTPDEFERILTAQNHRCYVCGTDTPTAKGWSVDHCHETNVVRFIACNPCNAALGLIKEDPRIAMRLYEVALECRQLRLV